jgi:hypothetical protein
MESSQPNFLPYLLLLMNRRSMKDSERLVMTLIEFTSFGAFVSVSAILPAVWASEEGVN